MDNLEKVEKLRERANVTYEEAKAALEANNWDLLDAMVALEKAGKTESPKQENYSTSYEQQEQYVRVQEKIEEEEAKATHSRTLGEALRRFFRICRDNYFVVSHHGDVIFQLPLIVTILILLFTWKVTVPVLLISLFFGVHYSFAGKDDLKGANRFMDTASNVADNIKEGFQNGGKKDEQ